MEIFVGQPVVLTVVGVVLALLSLRCWWLGPSALVCLFLGLHGAVASALMGLAFTLQGFVAQGKSEVIEKCSGTEKKEAQQIFLVLTLLSLMGLVGYSREGILYGLAAGVLPWSLYLPILRWMTCSSSVLALSLPLGLSVLFPMLRGEKLGVLGAMLVLFCVWAWHRAYYRSLRVMACLMALGFGANLYFDSPWAFGLLLLILLAQVLQQSIKGDAQWPPKLWLWLSSGLFVLFLCLANPNYINVAQLALIWALVWFETQGNGQDYRYADPAQQANVLSFMAARTTLVFASGSLLMGMNLQAWFVLMWVLLMGEAARFLSLIRGSSNNICANLELAGLKKI